MSKVICDVCGTTFPETATRCPICGAAKKNTAQTSAADTADKPEAADSSYAYVKGGRFSKSNVRRRSKSGAPMKRQSQEPAGNEENKGSNKGLVIVIVILLLAIIAVCIYIAARFFPSSNDNGPGESTGSSQSTQPSTNVTEPSELEIPCSDLQLSGTILEFTDTSRSQLLSAMVEPVDTTDMLVFISSDESVVTVSDTGLVTPVGSGEAIITVVCGNIVKECRVVCSFGAETEPTSPNTPVNPSGYILALNRTDFTQDIGATWNLYISNDQVKAEDIHWYSDNPGIASVENGKVTGVSSGKATVYAEYGDQKVSCIVRIRKPKTETPTEPAPTTPVDPNAAFTMTFNTTFISNGVGDATIHMGNTWKVYKSISIPADQVTWTSDNTAVATVSNGVVTPVAPGKCMVYAEYNGVKFACIIRVQN